VQTCTGKNPGDPDSPHGGAQDFQPTDEVADEVGKPVHRLSDLEERIGPFFVKARRPGGDGEGSHEKDACGLGEGPGLRGPKLQDRQALGR
jgi:hypothetical protein